MGVLGARRWWALAAVALAVLAIGLDLTVLNIAMPTLAVDLHAPTSQLQWFADSYTLVMAAALLPAGLLGDRYGRRTMLLTGLVLFGLASAACAWAPSSVALIAARAVLGLAAALIMPLSMAIVSIMFGPAERPKAIGVWAAATALGIPIGPVVGGLLLEHFWWGSVFLLNIPLTAIAVLAVVTLVPESRSERRPGIDWPGIALSSAGLLGITYGVIRAGEHGWGEAGAIGSMAAGAVLLAAFVRRTLRLTRGPKRVGPLVDLALFRSGGFTWGAVLATMVSFAMFGLLFVLPQFFQSVNGANTLVTGIRLLPMIGGLVAAVRISQWIAAKAGDKAAVAIGFVLIATGLLLGATTTTGTGYGFTATWLVILGLGLGAALPTAMNAATNSLSAERSGVGAALLMALRQVGGAIGVAILGTVSNAAYRGRLDLTGVPASISTAVRDSVNTGAAVARRLGSPELLSTVRIAFVHGMDTTLWVCGGLAVLGVLLAVAFLPSRTANAASSGGDMVERVEPDGIGSDHDFRGITL